MSRLRTLLGLLRTPATLAVAASLTVGLAQQPAQSAFSGTTASTGSVVASSVQFCTTPPTTLTSAGDSWTESAAPSATHGGDTFLKVSAAGTRTWIRFSLPLRPVGCVLDTAVLSVRARTPSPSRIIDVYRGNPLAPQWTSTAIAWANQPTGVGTRVGSASLSAPGWQSWTVTGHVTAQYSDGNNGFVLQDRGEGSGTAEQIYEDLQNATYPPTLVLTWN